MDAVNVADMRLGVVLPTSGPIATKANLLEIARSTEEFGLDAVWAFQRILYALESANDHRFLGGGTSGWPKIFESVLDPLQVLALVAAHTTDVRLGTCVINLPFYSPIVLAKELTTLDVLSDGRVDLGAGIGWSIDELAAVGVEPQRRGERGDEFLRCLRTIWSDEVVEFDGEFYRVPRSRIEPKPVQRPGPQVLVGGYVEQALRRAVTYGDGYIAGAVPYDKFCELVGILDRLLDEAGGERPFRVLSRIEAPQVGTGHSATIEAAVESLLATLDRYGRVGVTEVYIDFNASLVEQGTSEGDGIQHVLHMLETVARALGRR